MMSNGAFMIIWGGILALWDKANTMAAYLVCIGLVLLLMSTAFARDLGQWENTDPEIRAWIQSLMMPDDPKKSCCGEADSYWCEDLHTRRDYLGNAHNFCTITDDRDDAVLKRIPVPVGTEIEIPDRKMNRDPNPTGHSIIFLGIGHIVYCFISKGGV